MSISSRTCLLALVLVLMASESVLGIVQHQEQQSMVAVGKKKPKLRLAPRNLPPPVTKLPATFTKLYAAMQAYSSAPTAKNRAALQQLRAEYQRSRTDSFCSKPTKMTALEEMAALSLLNIAMNTFGDAPAAAAILKKEESIIKDKSVSSAECTEMHTEAKKLASKKKSRSSAASASSPAATTATAFLELRSNNMQQAEILETIYAFFSSLMDAIFGAEDAHDADAPAELAHVVIDIPRDGPQPAARDQPREAPRDPQQQAPAVAAVEAPAERPLKVGLELEYGSMRMFAKNARNEKLVLNEHAHYIAETATRAPGFDVASIRWGIDLPKDKVAITEIVTGPYSIGLNDGSGEVAEFLRLHSALGHMKASGATLRRSAAVPQRMSEIVTAYNNRLVAANMRPFRLQPVTTPAEGFTWYGYRLNDIGAGNLQVNYDIALSSVGVIKADGGHTPAVPTHFSDFFPPATNAEPAEVSYSSIYRHQLVGVQTVVNTLVDGLAADRQPLAALAGTQDLKDLKGMFVLYVMEAISKARVACLVQVSDYLAFGRISQEYFAAHEVAMNRIMKLPTGGAPKQERVQLIKTCVNDIARTFDNDRVLQPLKQWWAAGGRAAEIVAALQNQIAVGTDDTPAVRRTPTQCPIWAEAVVSGVRPVPAPEAAVADADGRLEGAANTLFWRHIQDNLDTLGEQIFVPKATYANRYTGESDQVFGNRITREAGGRGWMCITGTRFDSTVRPFRVLNDRRAVLMESRRRAMPFVANLYPGKPEATLRAALTAIRTVGARN